MTKEQFKKFYARMRKIKNSQYVGDSGYYSDLVAEFGVTMCFIHNLLDATRYTKRLVYGRYTREYQENQRQQDAWDSYHERMVGA